MRKYYLVGTERSWINTDSNAHCSDNDFTTDNPSEIETLEEAQKECKFAIEAAKERDFCKKFIESIHVEEVEEE